MTSKWIHLSLLKPKKRIYTQGKRPPPKGKKLDYRLGYKRRFYSEYIANNEFLI